MQINDTKTLTRLTNTRSASLAENPTFQTKTRMPSKLQGFRDTRKNPKQREMKYAGRIAFEMSDLRLE
jgi:hypothetical protein